MTTVDAITSELVAVLHRVTDGRLADLLDVEAENSLRRLGLDSVTTLAYLVAIEDAFGFEWSDDLSDDVLASFDAMARYIDAELGN
ncbi:MAG TPA: phosphopantetheine-binding protein [Nitriliruptorales bacterium]|nr:phosphopantetheine-binding protein [Nitriliruptorales bacterium]